MNTSPTASRNVCEQASWRRQCLPILLNVGSFAMMVNKSGSVDNLTTNRDFAWVPSGASVHGNIHTMAMMCSMGTPALRTTLKTDFEIHCYVSLQFASSNCLRSSALQFRELTSTFRRFCEIMKAK